MQEGDSFRAKSHWHTRMQREFVPKSIGEVVGTTDRNNESWCVVLSRPTQIYLTFGQTEAGR
jgi:hypothetical protein